MRLEAWGGGGGYMMYMCMQGEVGGVGGGGYMMYMCMQGEVGGVGGGGVHDVHVYAR